MYLNCHSYYSLRYGTFSEEVLLQLACEHQAKTIALTDINNTSGCLNFIRLAQKYDIKPVIGVDFRNGAEQLYILIAKSNEGFQHINSFLSKHKKDKCAFDPIAPTLPDTFVIYPLAQLAHASAVLTSPYVYIGISLEELESLHRTLSPIYYEKLVLLHTVNVRHKRDYNIHRLLRAIDNNVLLSKLPESEQGKPTEIMLPESELLTKLKDYPTLINNTQKVLAESQVFFDFGPDRKHQNLLSYSGDMATDYTLLEKLTEAGLNYRYQNPSEAVKKRVTMELSIIKQMDYVAFFLVNWDIVHYAKRKGYFHVGRGSGANSIVAYLLGITDVDPMALDLYFERFMNLYRANPPDFDLDFSWRDREDLTAYIFERFGKKGQVALLATYNTFQHSGAVRELGKVFGLPKSELDILSDGKYTIEALDDLALLVLKYAKLLHGIPNHLSVHAGGIIIAEKSIHYYTATDMPPKGFPTTQFDMVIAEDVGLYKYDILAQRGLGKIKDAISIVKENQPNAELPDIHQVKHFIEDPEINRKVSRAECIGCFYVESPAMRMLLKKLEVDNYLGLVAASSIIRPGVAQSGMMREYILRHKDTARRALAHPVMWELMEDTYGVMVYQEDVIKVAHHFAGLDLGEADVLRRGMSGKFRSREEFEKVKMKFMENCRAKGYPENTIQEIWAQTESFAGYAFAKGHSASYAIESYQSLFLKTYYPLEFMVAVLNNGGGFYRAETYIHEARMCGGDVKAPDINKSNVDTTIEGKVIYLGFQYLQGLEHEVAMAIVKNRKEHGYYASLEDFMDRLPDITLEQLTILLRIGAFDFTKKDKRTLLWEAHYRLNKQQKTSWQQDLFKASPKISFSLPKLTSSAIENVFDQLELLGFPLCDPFDLLLTPPDIETLAADIPNAAGKLISIYGYLVTTKNTRTSKGDRMYFGTFLDQAGHWIDTVHFPPVAKKYPFRGRGVYRLTGKATEEFGFYTLEITEMVRMPYILDPRYTAEVAAANHRVRPPIGANAQ